MMSTTDRPGVGTADLDEEPGGLAAAQERAFLIALATEDTIWDWDLKSNHLELSPKAAKFGYDDWAAHPNIKWWEDRIHPDDRDATVAAFTAAIRSGRKYCAVEYRFCKADGDFVYIYDRAFILHDEDGVAVRAVGAMIDVTELHLVKQSLRKTQNQLALVSRLNAMGTMSSMIAHELSQPLTAAANYMRASRRLSRSEKAADMAALQEALTAAEENTLRAGDIIRRLRELVGRGDLRGCETSLAELIDDSCAIARGIENSRMIHLRTIVEPLDITVWVDPIQIQQVIINLLRNSIEALEKIDGPEIIVRAEEREGFAEISVQDNGCGITDDVRESVFSAVMTAKAAGMGIGLSISRTIIEAQGGEIWLARSAPGITDFRFTLPLLRPDKPEKMDI
ncbi:ATP-binding protein [Parasphingorhabdus sp.]|uniref:ATP-binding protein n=1 Tax=Parasphingorhabdus sp. TaxID=2709688 RepID=UPI0035946680